MATVLVNVKQGTLRGRKVTPGGVNSCVYYSFQGIPYAKPPVGPLRFRPPEPPVPWKGERDATKEGNVAAQAHVLNQTVFGSENCLFLNVYTPDLSPAELKAVMFWIHGGSGQYGSGNSDMYKPDYLVAKDIILVTLNFRLGALGQLMLPGTDTTANNPIRDQIAALKWVQENISKFGGDPNKITLAGQSSGACYVHQLILSPASKGLFHRAICQSSTALVYSCYTTPLVLQRRSLLLARALGCKSKDSQEIIDFLRTVPAEEIVKIQSEFFIEQEKRQMGSPFVVCANLQNHDDILPGLPEQLIKQGKFQNIPILLGVNSGDGKIVLADFTKCVPLDEIENKFEAVVPYDMAARCGTEKCKAIAERLKEYYFGTDRVSHSTLLNYIKMENDLIFNYPVHKTIKEVCNHKDAPPMYLYLFDHKKTGDGTYLLREYLDLPGAAHNDDLHFLFGSNSTHGMKPADIKVSTYVRKLWTNFIKTGNPNDIDLPLKWPPVDKDNQYSLNIAEELTVQNNQFEDRMKFLEQLHAVCRILKDD